MTPSFINITGGLVGMFDNNDENDFTLRDGTVLPKDATTEELHAFGLSWRIRDINESLFYYDDNAPFGSFDDDTFVPLFDLNATDLVIVFFFFKFRLLLILTFFIRLYESKSK